MRVGATKILILNLFFNTEKYIVSIRAIIYYFVISQIEIIYGEKRTKKI